MKNLSESIKSKIINEDWDSVYLFKYEIKQDPILIHIQLTTAYWNGYGEDDLDFLEEEIGKKRLEYGYYQIKGIARVENKKSNFEIVLKFSNSSSETVTSAAFLTYSAADVSDVMEAFFKTMFTACFAASTIIIPLSIFPEIT
jgi:hypothetical protein